ncbi:hypothetical protein SBA4_1610019 [Candidatus Sulfopaludibacter sp. SbA4]|nr:hypothetical protein SBA4_1610019 [Candidatus Sulfopaludibacter sp. SbA4]
MPEEQRHYGQWSRDELHQAEATACQFLEENSTRIAETMQAKATVLEHLIEQLSLRETSFADRLEYFARASEVARLIQADADGFFDLASQPMVARILGTVPPEEAQP